MSDEPTPTDSPRARRKETRERLFVWGFVCFCAVCGTGLALWVTR